MKPDLILYHGKLITQDPQQPQASAIAIRAGRILALGDDEDMLELAAADSRRIDLEGRLALPGLTDAHFHLYDWSHGRQQLLLSQASSLDDLLERLKRYAAQQALGTWIRGQGWNETRWPSPALPTRHDLDRVAPQHPVILWRSDFHLAVANSLALQQAGIGQGTRSPVDGVIDRDANGQPTGVLRELAINLVSDVIPPYSEQQTLQALRAGLPALHALGLTGVHDFRLMGGPEAVPAFRAYQELDLHGELNLRLWMNLPGERLDEAIALGLRSGFGSERLQIGHLKLFSDGSQGARTAWMLEPYQDTGECGLPLTPMPQIAEAIRKADAAGIAVAIHAIGDRANRELLDVFEEVLGNQPQTQAAVMRTAAPHRIEHVQNIRPEDLRRMGRLGIYASVQPVHVIDDLPMIDASVGERSRFSYAFRDLVEAGVQLALGSDSPVADPNPLLGIYAAVTRQQLDGSPQGGWYPRQRLSLAEALWGYTMGPALVSGQAGRLGSLTPGKLADLVVLDRDLLTIDPHEIPETHPLMTFFDGQMVYNA